MSNTSFEEDSTNQINKSNQMGILSIMEAFDKQSRIDEKDRENTTNQSFDSYSASQKQFYRKNSKKLKKVKLDAQFQQLKSEFEDAMKKQAQREHVDFKECEYKKLLDDVVVQKKDREKGLISQYITLEKYLEKEKGEVSTMMSNNKSKLNTMNISFRSITLPYLCEAKSKLIMANNTSIIGGVNTFQNTEVNIEFLQEQVKILQNKEEEIYNKQLLEENKRDALYNMEKEIQKTKNMVQEELNHHNRVLEQFEIQINQATERSLKYELELNRINIDIDRSYESMNFDRHNLSVILDGFKDKTEEQKTEVNQAVTEYKKLQVLIQKASDEFDQSLIKIDKEDERLVEKYKKMIESRKLMKKLDDFDLLTKTFIYRTPDEEEVEELLQKVIVDKEKSQMLQQNTENSIFNQFTNLTQDEKDLLEIMQFSDENGQGTVPQYKLGTIMQRLKDFIYEHNNNIDITISQIVSKYQDQNMEYNTLNRRLQDLQEQKRELTQQLIKIEYENQGSEQAVLEEDEEQEEINDKVLNLPNLPDNKIETQLRERNDSVKLVQSQIGNIEQKKETNIKQNFICQQYLFFNEILFRFSGITGVMKSITNINKQVAKDSYLQRDLFDNELYANLEQMIKFAISNKDSLPSKELIIQKEGSEEQSQQQQTESTSLAYYFSSIDPQQQTKKMMEIKKIIQQHFPQLSQIKVTEISHLIQHEFVLQYFCSLDDYHEMCKDINKETKESQCLEYIYSFMSNMKFNKERLMKIIRSRTGQSIEEIKSDLQKNNQSGVSNKQKGKKDWKDKVIRKKIEEFESQKGKQEMDMIEENDYTNMGESQLENAIKIDEEIQPNESYANGFRKEEKHIQKLREQQKQILQREKQRELDQLEEIQRKEEIAMKEPKVIARYNESSKYAIKYLDNWRFLVQQKKQFHKITSEHEKQRSVMGKKQQTSKNTLSTTLNSIDSNEIAKAGQHFPHYNASHHLVHNYNAGKNSISYQSNSAGKTLMMSRHQSQSGMKRSISVNKSHVKSQASFDNKQAKLLNISRQGTAQSGETVSGRRTVAKRSISTYAPASNQKQSKEFKLQPINNNNKSGSETKKLSNTERIQQMQKQNLSYNPTGQQYPIGFLKKKQDD